MKRKMFNVLLGVLMLGVAACGAPSSESTLAQNPLDSSNADTGVAAAETEVEVEKPAVIKLMVDGTFMTPEAGQADIVAKYKELTGIDLEITQPAHNQYYEKVNLVFATGDLPDVLILGAENAAKYGSNGVLYDMKPLYDKSEILQSIDEEKIIAPMLVDGKLFSMPKGNGGGTVTFVRQDWLDQLGMDAPTNYDEFIEMLRGFKTLGDNIIPYTAPGIISDEYPSYIYTREFFQDAVPDFVQIDGEWVDGMLQPNMKDALNRLRSAFAEGLIDMEIVTNATSTCRDKFASGITGTFNYWSGWAQALDENLKAADPNAEITPIYAIDGVNYIERIAGGLAITSACENPEAVFKYLIEFMYDKGEGQMLFVHGAEGIHYEIKDGVFTKLPSKANATQPSGQVMLSQGTNINGFDDPYELDARTAFAHSVLAANVEVAPLVPPSEAKDKYITDIQILRKEIIADIVYGNTTVEAGLARYETETKDSAAAILAELNK